MTGRSWLQTELRTFSVAALGQVNPLPMVGPPLENPYRITGDLPQDIIDASHYGNPANLHPYQLQDDYTRNRSPRQLQTVVLENDLLLAEFLPELGGRLWRLFDKKSGKQLLHSPDTVQFANLALRNAWFAGGIEWNIGTRGHSPTTCGPLHAGMVRTPEGRDVLRMWEFDRLRQVVFQIEAWLPADSAVLLVAIRIRNPNTVDVPMYWWTNAAVPQHPDSRVLAPATSAFASDYSGGIARVDPTEDDGTDGSWPARNVRARDFFFDIAPADSPWIVNTDRDGDGLAMLSTPGLRGRKLFVWGQGAGGQRWQHWLSPDGGQYAEIQAGLAQTQFQHLTMPAGAEWSWVEAYGNASVDPAIAHGSDWGAAVRECGSRVASLLDAAALNAALAAADGWKDLPPIRSILAGSGWGALEAGLRRRLGRTWVDEAGTPFAVETLTAPQQPWWKLLQGNGFTGATAFVGGADWGALLAAEEPTAGVLLHRGVIQQAAGDHETAAAFYLQTLDADPLTAADGAQAHRGLALIALADGALDKAMSHYGAACGLLPASIPLLVEAATAALTADDAEEALRLIGAANLDPNASGRVRFLQASALARTGDAAGAAAILRAGIEVADLREGEDSIAVLWQQVCPTELVPVAYQFAMG